MGGIEIYIFILLIIYIASLFFCVNSFVDIAENKGCGIVKSRIWVLAILGTPLLAALYVIALPDRSIN